MAKVKFYDVKQGRPVMVDSKDITKMTTKNGRHMLVGKVGDHKVYKLTK